MKYLKLKLIWKKNMKLSWNVHRKHEANSGLYSMNQNNLSRNLSCLISYQVCFGVAWSTVTLRKNIMSLAVHAWCTALHSVASYCLCFGSTCCYHSSLLWTLTFTPSRMILYLVTQRNEFSLVSVCSLEEFRREFSRWQLKYQFEFIKHSVWISMQL